MNNLFSTFDPQSWFSFPLNWASALIPLSLLPAIYWISPNQPAQILKKTIGSVTQEFLSVANPNSVPGLVILPLTLLLFIGLNNSLGLLPYVFTSSSHLTLTLSMAIPLWVGHILLGWLKTSQNMLAHLVPLGTPGPLMPFMVFIELISSLIRPLTLAVRLAANMVAGHLLLSLLGGPAPSLTWISLSLLLAALVLLTMLECAVSLIQSYVFSILSTLYINEVNSPSIS